jgi:hypothetical protein
MNFYGIGYRSRAIQYQETFSNIETVFNSLHLILDRFIMQNKLVDFVKDLFDFVDSIRIWFVLN